MLIRQPTAESNIINFGFFTMPPYTSHYLLFTRRFRPGFIAVTQLLLLLLLLL